MREAAQEDYMTERLCILVVEDSDLLRGLFRLALGGAHLIYTAHSTQEGWRVYLDKNPDIIFMDIGLPDGSGHDLARKIKEHNSESYIVMATASREMSDKLAAAHNHVDGFVTKPFDKQGINSFVGRYLSLRRRLM